MNFIVVAFLICTLIAVQPVCSRDATATVGADAISTADAATATELRGPLPASPSAAVSSAAPAAPQSAAPARFVSLNGVTISVECDYIPIDHMRGLLVEVSNHSVHPVVVNCDAAKVILAPPYVRDVASLLDLEKLEKPPQGFIAVFKDDAIETILAAFTVGAVQAIEGINSQCGPILKRYGADERRRQNEVQRFGKRLLWPGEISSGTIFFKTDESLNGFTLLVPLSRPFIDGKNPPPQYQYISTKIETAEENEIPKTFPRKVQQQ